VVDLAVVERRVERRCVDEARVARALVQRRSREEHKDDREHEQAHHHVSQYGHGDRAYTGKEKAAGPGPAAFGRAGDYGRFTPMSWSDWPAARVWSATPRARAIQ